MDGWMNAFDGPLRTRFVCKRRDTARREDRGAAAVFELSPVHLRFVICLLVSTRLPLLECYGPISVAQLPIPIPHLPTFVPPR